MPKQKSGSMLSSTQRPGRCWRRPMGNRLCCGCTRACCRARAPRAEPPIPRTTKSQHHSSTGLPSLRISLRTSVWYGSSMKPRRPFCRPAGQILLQGRRAGDQVGQIRFGEAMVAHKLGHGVIIIEAQSLACSPLRVLVALGRHSSPIGNGGVRGRKYYII